MSEDAKKEAGKEPQPDPRTIPLTDLELRTLRNYQRPIDTFQQALSGAELAMTTFLRHTIELKGGATGAPYAVDWSNKRLVMQIPPKAVKAGKKETDKP